MRDRVLRNKFQCAVEEFSALTELTEVKKRGLSLDRIRQEAQHKQIEMPPSPVRSFRMQLYYMNKCYLWFPILMIPLILGGVRFLGIGSLQERELLSFLSALISLTGLLGVISVGRIFSYHMGELQMCCFWGVGEIAAMRMILSGFVDGCLILVCSFALKGCLQREFLEILLYIVTPFLLSNCIYFGILLLVREKGKILPLAAAGILNGSIWLLLLHYPFVYERGMYLAWILALFFSGILLGTELLIFFRQMKKGEIVCLL